MGGVLRYDCGRGVLSYYLLYRNIIMKGPESRLVTRILKHLRSLGGVWFKIHGGLYQVIGLPDIVGCYKGGFYYFEVKTPEKFAKKDHHLTAKQREMMFYLDQAGAHGQCVCSVDQVKELMGLWARFDMRG